MEMDDGWFDGLKNRDGMKELEMAMDEKVYEFVFLFGFCYLRT
jgi:hypothetical protein